MADQQTDLAIVIEAVNKASTQLKQVEKDLGGLTDAVKSDGAAATTASLGFGQLVAGVATGTVVAQLAMRAMQGLYTVLTQIPASLAEMGKYASEVSGIGIAMHIVANNAGITAEAVDKVRDSVVEQNVTTEAANRLMTDLIRNQLEYTQATELASAAQNIAVASGVSSSETIERISDSIASGNTWLLRQLGLVEHLDVVYKKYGETLGKTSEEMTEAERKQAVVNYVLQEGEKYAGAYDAAMQNASKVMRSTSDRVKEISYAFGQILEPAMYQVAKAVYDAVNNIVKWAHEHEAKLRGIANAVGEFMKSVVGAVRQFVASIPWGVVVEAFNVIVKQVITFGNSLKIVYNAIQIFCNGVSQQINMIKSLGAALSALIRGDFAGLQNVYADWRANSQKTNEAIIGNLDDIGDAFRNSYDAQSFDLKEWWDSVEEIEGSGWEDRLKQAEEQGQKLSQKQKDTLEKMAHDLEKENKNYQQEVAKRAKAFSDSFDDLVITHRDKIKDLTDDLASESRDYKEKLTDLLSDYNEAMTDIEKRHAEKTKSVNDDMEEERKKALEEIEKITEKYNEERVLIEREGEDRLSTLKAQLDRELALGENADQAKIEALRQMIAHEEDGLALSLEEKKAKYDEEVSDVNEALDDKLQKLKDSLAEEDIAYAESFAKRKTQYEEDLADAKASYEEKRAELQKNLDEEIAIRTKYADDFKRIGDKIADDDITRLITTYNTEKAEMEREHQERLAEIKYQAFKGGEEFGTSFAAGFDASYPEVKSRLNTMQNDIQRTINYIDELSQKAKFASGFSSGYAGGGGGGGGAGSWAEGGVVTKPSFGMVGESGTEVILPLNFPKRMANIMKSMGIGGGIGSQVTQTFYITVKNVQDVDLLMERAGFAMKTGGGYR